MVRGKFDILSGGDSFDETRHPEMFDSVFELLAVHVTFEKFRMFLNTCSPIILYLVICSSG